MRWFSWLLILVLVAWAVLAVPVLAQEPGVSFDEGLLTQLLIRLLQTGSAGVIVYWLLEQPFVVPVIHWLEGISAQLTLTASELKRYVAIAASTLVSLGLYMLLVLVDVSDLPVGWVAWIDLILWLGGLSYGASQVVHARREL